MNFFAIDFRKFLIILVMLSLPFISINMQRNPGDEAWYKKPVGVIVGLLQEGFFGFTSGVHNTTGMYLKIIGVKRDNETLRKENQELRAKLDAMTELKLENDRMTKLLDFKHNSKMELMAAKVIARDLSPDHFSIRINRGLRDGLKKLQAVITVEGVVGYVYRAEAISSQVLVLTDRAASIDATVQRTRARGLVQGKGSSVCRLRYLERADDVAIGDMIVTSGLQGFFPKGFPIGRVLSVRKTDYGISQEAQIQPVVNPANLEEVFVVVSSNSEDYSNRNGEFDFGPPLLSKQMGSPLSAPALDTSKIQAAAKAASEDIEIPKAEDRASDPSPVKSQGE